VGLISKIRKNKGVYIIDFKRKKYQPFLMDGEASGRIKSYVQTVIGKCMLLIYLLIKKNYDSKRKVGEVTINPEFLIEVSKRLYEDYGKGKDYNKFHGCKLQIMPSSSIELPLQDYIIWHNEHCYKY
jgi:hypothetical protein